MRRARLGQVEDDMTQVEKPQRDNLAHTVRARLGQVGPGHPADNLAHLAPPLTMGGQGPGLAATRAAGVDRAFVVVDVEGVPQPEPRPRFNRQTGHTYVPGTANDWKHDVRAQVKLALQLDPALAGVVPIPDVAWAFAPVFRMPRPKNHWRAGRHAGKLKPWAEGLPHLAVPDLDNLIKAVLDAVGAWDGMPRLLWCNDSQVVRHTNPDKRYVRPGERPGLCAAFYVMENPPC